MADDSEEKQDAREVFLIPAITAFKIIGVFLDVATLMVRLLFNTVAYNTPHGKLEVADARPERAQSMLD